MAMRHGFVSLFWVSAILAQVPRQQPLDAVVQAYWTAQSAGRFEEAAARRDEARRLIEVTPPSTPGFAYQVQQVANFYDTAGMASQARGVVEQALARAGGAGPARMTLLNALADLWQNDRNLLKALSYREQAAAALESAPAAPSETPATAAGTVWFTRVEFVPDSGYIYQQLAHLYRTLGRRNDLEALVAKLRAGGKNDALLASIYEQQEQLEQAAASYRSQAERAGDPQQAAAALQQLANVYEREQRYSDAATALEQAVFNIETGAPAEAQNQTIWIRQRLATILDQAGQTEAADRLYTQLLDQTRGGADGLQSSVLTGYAFYLSRSKRADAAENMLEEYLANLSILPPWEEANILSALSNAARMANQPERADEYQLAAMEKQRASQPVPPGQVSISSELQQAQFAASHNRLDEAFRLTLDVIEKAEVAVDRYQLPWQMSSIATTLVNSKSPAMAEQLYRRAFSAAEQWTPVNLEPLLTLEQQYVRLLMAEQRWEEVPDAIQRYRSTLVSARGEGTGWLEAVLRLSIEVARAHGSPEQALPAAQDLLALEETLTGTTSEPYLSATEQFAELLESSGDFDRALPLRRQAITISDLVLGNEGRRSFSRMNAAMTLAHLERFDEAEQLAGEAIALAKTMRPPQPDFGWQVQQIREMKANSVQSRAPWLCQTNPGRPERPPQPGGLPHGADAQEIHRALDLLSCK